MYDSFGSPAWIFDRCQEVGYFAWVVIIGSAILSGLLGFWVSRKGLATDKSWGSRVAQVLVPFIFAGFTLFLSFFFLLYAGFFIFNCEARTKFWPGIITGHEIHAKIKEAHRQHQTPRNISELQQLAPQFMQQLASQAKYSYTYDPQQNRYTFMVRTSRYSVAVYDQQLNPAYDYNLYVLSPLSNFNQTQPTFPPPVPGPWEQLPK